MANKGFRMEGVDDIEKVLAGLPGRFGEKVVTKTLRKSAKPLIAEAKQNAPEHKGNLKKSIGAINGRGGGKGSQIYVGPRRGGSFKGYHAHLVEYGTAPRKLATPHLATILGKTVLITHTGSMPAHPFLRPAYDAKIGEVQEVIKQEFRSILESGFRNVFK
jgi:HK97 gp10 family phage protein